MSTYPTGIVSSAQLPTRVDGAVIYGAHVNLIQDEVISIENTLGLGTSLLNGFGSLVLRLSDYDTRVTLADGHRAASSGVHGVVGSVVGTTDTQTLTNKTLTAPALSGTISAGGTTFAGGITFSGAVVFSSTVALTPTISDFTTSQHNHSSAATGGNIPISSVTSLVSTLATFSIIGHTHVKANITDFQHTLAEHTGQLVNTRIDGLGTSSTLDVPIGAGATASGTQVVRGDDPRLTNTRNPNAHAASHASNGSDVVSPASIGAAPTSHTHTKAQVTDFAHLLTDHSGSLAIAAITGLQTALDGKLPVGGTAANSTLIGGKKVTVSTGAPVGPAVGDVWISY